MRLGTSKANRADGDTVAYQGDVECGAEAQALRVLDADGKSVGLGLHVGDVDCPRGQHCPADTTLTAQRESDVGGNWSVTSSHAQMVRFAHEE